MDPVGRSGGLMIVWQQDVQIELVNYSQRHISIVVTYGS